MHALFWTAYGLLGCSLLATQAWSLPKNILCLGLLLCFPTLLPPISPFIASFCWVLYAGLAFICLHPTARRRCLIQPAFRAFKQSLPTLSETEKTALEASTPWWESEFFKGRPDWNRLLTLPKPTLTAEEQAFLDGPVETLCAMANNWQIAYTDRDLPPEIWAYLKEAGFMGFIIPKEYGGLGFSGLAHSAIAAKIAGHCSTLAVTVSVPNTLGPAELLMHYGTNKQRQYYLPRLAKGLEIPCFALTGPEAGSDASAIPDTGIVSKGVFEGQEIIGIRLNWNKRYITLAPIATVLGLAFKLYDPEQLYFPKTDLGITCALIPTHSAGITIGRRHWPGGSPFQNGPTTGKEVFIPLDWIIGGPAMAGHGWRMLVECLAAGRAITLPGSSTGCARAAALACGAYSRIRQQFHSALCHFEGIQEVLGKIAGLTYMCEATRTLTALAVDLGERPAVPSAIAKCYITDMARRIGLMTMDIHAGKAVMMGPKNYVVNGYQTMPTAITVEGANILTRNLIIFGQGALRCHPYVLAEMNAAQTDNLEAFGQALRAHVGAFFNHLGACFIHGLTGSRWVIAPEGRAFFGFQQLTRASHAFALLTDLTMATLGSKLKFKENLSARLGDMLANLYMASACIKHFYDQGQPTEDWPLLQWSVEHCLYDFWTALSAVLQNFPNRFLARVLQGVILPLGLPTAPPSDALTRQLAKLLSSPNATRDRLTAGTFLKAGPNNPLSALETALKTVIAAEPAEQKMRQAVKEGLLPDRSLRSLLEQAQALGILNQTEGQQMEAALRARDAIVAVDDFEPSL